MDLIGLLDPAIGSKNIGDQVISEACHRFVSQKHEFSHIVTGLTHSECTGYLLNNLAQCSAVYVGGSNLLCSNMEFYNQWHLNNLLANGIKVRLLGVGSNDFAVEFSPETCEILEEILDPFALHSVRDEHLANRLRELGNYVVNTSCPTLWDNTNQITGIGENGTAIVVLNSDKPDRERDLKILKYAANNYGSFAYVWPQTIKDADYAASLDVKHRNILRPRLSELDRGLGMGSDYIGTRVHAGIRAIQHNCISNIINVDDRAKSLGLLSFDCVSEIKEKFHSIQINGVDKWLQY